MNDGEMFEAQKLILQKVASTWRNTQKETLDEVKFQYSTDGGETWIDSGEWTSTGQLSSDSIT